MSIKLFDVLGREVSTLLKNELLAGGHSVSFHTGDLPKGMYIYRMRAKQSSGKIIEESKKLLILK